MGWAYLHIDRNSEAEQTFPRSLDIYDENVWAQLGYVAGLAMQGKSTEAKSALVEVNRLAPEFGLNDMEIYLKNSNGHPASECEALIERQVKRLGDIWPS